MTTKQLSSLFVFNTLLLSAEVNANQQWDVVNDSVMGGVSTSHVMLTQAGLIFEGNISLENNGGFASIRTDMKIHEQNPKAINLRVKGDGNTYQLRLRTANELDGPAFTHSFKTINNKWIDINIAPKDFVLTFRGKKLEQQPVVTLSKINQLGFLIADSQEGHFKLEVDKIEFVD